MEQLSGQMNVFDFPEYLPTNEIDFETMDILEAVKEIEKQVNLKFKLNEFKRYSAKYKKLEIEIGGFLYYSPGVRDGRRFLDIGYSLNKSGGGSPCESIDEAVKYIKKRIDEMDRFLKIKPIEWYMSLTSTSCKCPHCKNTIKDDHAFGVHDCSVCGQPIDWDREKTHMTNDYKICQKYGLQGGVFKNDKGYWEDHNGNVAKEK